MDSLTIQKPKSRKIKKIAKKSRGQIIFDLFSRSIEIVVVLVTLAKLCYELVIMLEDSGVASVILANRNLAFVLGNAIVIALIAKSGLFSNQEVELMCRSNDLYAEFVRESSRRDRISQVESEEAKQNITENRAIETEAEKQSKTENRAKQSISDITERQSVTEKKKTKQSKPEKMKKQSISVKIEKQSRVECEDITEKKMEKQNTTEKRQIQSYQRSLSENLEGSEKISCGKLRRSEKDESSERFDSDDELRDKIESFIARQRRNQKDD